MEHLENQEVHLLPPKDKFKGAGIYAIYYRGEHELYQKLKMTNKGGKCTQPIYVGKAIPEGGRIGGMDFGVDPGNVLYNRLAKHSRSIKSVSNLNLEDFCCRYLVVDDIWIPLGENLLISKKKPLWNTEISGFGINDPGQKRSGMRPVWDTLHPGRKFKAKLGDRPQSAAEIEEILITGEGKIELSSGEKQQLADDGDAEIKEEKWKEGKK